MAAAVAEQPNDQLKAGTFDNKTAVGDGEASGILTPGGRIPGTLTHVIFCPFASTSVATMYFGFILCN